MDSKQIERLSHRLSRILRHGIAETGLPMDAAGWVEIAGLLAHLRVARADLDAVIAGNNKLRYQVDSQRVRAAQGHSLAGMPVTQEALEASWEVYRGADSVWHGTNLGAAEAIAHEGISPGQRSHVHLAMAVDSKVGKRANVQLLLEVSVLRLRDVEIEVFVSSNAVVLTRRVPAACVVGVRAVSAKAVAQVADLRVLFGQ